MLFGLDPDAPQAPFPDAELAETEPDGLLAVGGDLKTVRLLNAYRAGIFPWYSPGQPILWWSPNPRTVLFPQHLKVSRSLKKTLRKRRFSATLDRDFEAVIRACSDPRGDEQGTWILPEMISAYTEFHHAGHAHSVEVWLDQELAGGLYGVAIGRVFFGESMFSRVSDASKVALVHLVNVLKGWRFRMIDCQLYSDHLVSLGAEEIPRRRFIDNLNRWCDQTGYAGLWSQLPATFPEIPEFDR